MIEPMAVHDIKPISWDYDKIVMQWNQVEISVSCGILKIKENILIGGDIMAKRIIYPNIDMQQTGRKLKLSISCIKVLD